MKHGGLGLQSLTEDVESGVQAAAELWFNQCQCNRLALRCRVSGLIERGIAQARAAPLDHRRPRFAATCHASGYHELVEVCSNLWISDHRMTQRRPIVIEQKQVNRGSFDGLVNTSAQHDREEARLACLREWIHGYCRSYTATCRKGSKVGALDDAILFETSDCLAEKYRHFQPLSDPVRTFRRAKEYSSGLIVIGAGEAWCSRNEEMLKASKMPISDMLLCAMTVEHTNQLASWFMRSNEALAFTRRSAVRMHEGHGHHPEPTVFSCAPGLAT
uniref:Uncharacterized protein n=1 Tax=Trichuris muris TaxID=70415 RepID=A0A5S6Q2M2_TRIMR